MKRFLRGLLFILVIGALCIFFGESVWSVIKEIVIFYGIVAVVAVVILCYLGWALTRAMNPKYKEPEE